MEGKSKQINRGFCTYIRSIYDNAYLFLNVFSDYLYHTDRHKTRQYNQ